jgi:hypothetical protein
MPKVWCAAIECKHNKENQCTRKKINLSAGHTHTVLNGYMQYWECRMFNESSESAELRRKIESFLRSQQFRDKEDTR